LAQCDLFSSVDLGSKVTFNVGVAESGLSTGPKFVSHSRHDVPPALLCIEETSPVTEAAGLVIKVDELARPKIVGPHLRDGFGDLLAVGSYILDWSTAYVSR